MGGCLYFRTLVFTSCGLILWANLFHSFPDCGRKMFEIPGLHNTAKSVVRYSLQNSAGS